MTTALVWP